MLARPEGVLFALLFWISALREFGILLPNSQRQHRTLKIQENVLPDAL
jgi:hypothetical protein